MINVLVVGGWALIGLTGEFDLANSAEIVSVGAQLANQGVADITVDLTKVTFLAVAGCNALTALNNLFQTAGRMVLIGETRATRRVLQLSGLERELPLLPPSFAEPEAADADPLRAARRVAATDDAVRSRLGELHRLLLAEGSVAERLRHIARATVRIVPGATAATIVVCAHGEPRTAAVSDAVAIDVDAAQYLVNEGPCLKVARSGGTVRVDALGADERFTHFAPLALEVGIRAVMSVPVTDHSNAIGALNIYSTTAFGPAAEARADVMASLAARALATSTSYA